MLSRVADHLYWMSRYIERAENIARLMQVSVELLLDSVAFGSQKSDEYWTPVLAATAMEGAFRLLHPDPAPGDISHFLTLDERNPDSILSCIREARENARTVRDQITDEMWAELNALYLLVSSQTGVELLERSPQSFFEKIIHSSLQFDGITAATLSRSEGWNFLQLGRYLERADKTSRFLDIKSQHPNEPDTAVDSLQWGTILRACSAYASYRRVNGSEVTLEKILELLLFSVEFPRSVRFCVRTVDQMLHAISGTPTGQYSNKCEKLTGALLAKLNFAAAHDVLEHGLHEYIDNLQVALNEAGQAIYETYVHLPQEYTKSISTSFILDPIGAMQQQQQQQQQQQ
ncbi:MAG: alpha-E domain-containing protein [Verrucomicrobiota bacterium]